LVAGLLGSDYRSNQMTYDLRRLRLNGLIRRLPHSNRYILTSEGTRIAICYTKVYNRLIVSLTAADQPPSPPDLRAALNHHQARRHQYAAARARLARTA
jgi:predicted MarR family transcription regulator